MLIFELPGLHGFSRRVPVVGRITTLPLVAPVLRCCLSLIVIMQHQPKPEHIRLTASFLRQFFILITVSHNFFTLLVMSRPSCKMSSSGCIDKYFQRTKFNSFSVRKHPTKPHRHVKATIIDGVGWAAKEGRKPPKGGKYYVC